MRRPTLALAPIALAFGLSALPATAQPPTMDEAGALFDAEDWAAAAEAYEAIWAAAEDPAAVPLRVPARAAKAHLRLGHRDEALDWLQRGVDLGLPLPFLDGDPGLAELRDEERFAEIRKVAERATFPCRYEPRYHEFDFWIGSWDVYAPTGAKAGTNTIARASEGCMLYESWTNASGIDGHSINYVDPATDEWVQVWMGADGTLIHGRGGVADGAMSLVGEHVLKTGERRPFRMTYTPHEDKSVRQLMEESTDGGETWSAWFDGRYVPAGSTPPAAQ